MAYQDRCSFNSTPGADRTAFPGSRFPAAHFDSLLDQFIPAFNTEHHRAEAAYAELFRQRGPLIVISHSAAARTRSPRWRAIPARWPAHGITGNSHMIMFDDNAGDILSMIIS